MKLSAKMLVILSLCSLMCSSAFAQDNPTSANANNAASDEEWEMWGWTFSAGLEYILLDEVAATSERIEDSAFSLNLNASYYFSSRIMANMGMGLLKFSDNAEFSQQVIVTNLFGSDVETVESDAGAIQFYTEALYLTPPVGSTNIYFRAGVGYAGLAFSERSIDKCADCREENIDITGGPYLTGGVVSEFGSNNFHIGLSIRQYLSGDINNSAILMFEYIH